MRSPCCYFCALIIIVPSCVNTATGPAQDLPDGADAATKQMATFRVPAGMTVELFAAEPQLASPVAIGLDEHNRVFVAEEYRFNLGTEENRTRPFLLDDDLQLQTANDRLRMYEKWAAEFEGGMEWFKKTADQVRLVEDTDGDGRADRSTVFAAGFNGTLDGLAAGVMATDGDVFFTCIPNLWRLRDTNGDGVADEREILQSGFGVNAGFLGHDLHGLCWGPDGKLYFSVGDRGFHLRTRDGRTLHGPRNGAIFRCLPDGSEMEVVMRGLRNPQEIIFDKYGNLFAADNNCDKGDHSRLVYVIEGGHSGWNMAFQSLPEPYLTGPWHAEKMWHLPESQESAAGAAEGSSATMTPAPADDRPAWLLPPVGKLGAGPSGFAYYPGTGLAERYDHHFLLCNYTGNGGIESFSIVPRGAGFQIVDEHDFLKPVFATDCEFGYDGRLYVSDFVNLIWNGGTSGGRIYRVTDSANQSTAVVTETANLMRAGIRSLPPEKLSELLGHADLRVRQRAQFALAAMGESSESIFIDATAAANPQLKRLHGIWGLGQIAADAHRRQLASVSNSDSATPSISGRIMQQENKAADALALLLNDEDSEVRAQVIRTLGDLRYQPLANALITKLKDSDSRVRMFAALAVGRIKYSAALPDVIEMLRVNGQSDPWLRHAGVIALTGIKDRSALLRYATDEDPSIRMAVLLIFRKWLLEPQEQWVSTEGDEIPLYEPDVSDVEAIVAFLNDKDLQIVAEAARAINDLPLESATPNLASYLENSYLEKQPADSTSQLSLSTMPDSLLRRIINANFRIGDVASLQRVLKISQSSMCSFPVRQEALHALIDWTAPPSRDRVTGFWRPLNARDAAEMNRCREFLAIVLPSLLATTPDMLQSQLVTLINRHQLPIDDEEFAGWVTDSSKTSSVRVAALRLLVARDSEKASASVTAALNSELGLLRAEARDAMLKLEPDRARELLIEIAQSHSGAILERQRAVTALATLQHEAADAVLLSLAEQLVDGTLHSALHLEVIEAATLRNTSELKSAADQYKAKQGGKGLLAQYQTAVDGGHVEEGRNLFVGHRVAQCVRCHKVGNVVSGGTAGPDLNQVAKRYDRMTLLQSLVEPSAKIAKGFETVTIVLQSGQLVAGIIRSEENGKLIVEQPDGKVVTLNSDDVDERTAPKSAMPEVHRALTLRELRDLVEFLSSLK